MNIETILQSNDYKKVEYALLVSEKVIINIKNNQEKYLVAKEAINKCRAWVKNRELSGDDLYELLDNPECTGISEFAMEEDDISMINTWNLLVDIVAYTSWIAYKNENAKYLPQALEGIREENIKDILENAIETGFVTEQDILNM